MRIERFLIIKVINTVVKGKVNIMTDHGDINKMTSIKSYKVIKSQQDKNHISNLDVVVREKEYIMLTRKVKMAIKDQLLKLIRTIQHEEIIKRIIKQERHIKVQKSILDKMPIYITIE